jgi:prophage tail gpP-like protein
VLNSETVTVLANGMQWTAWKSVNVMASFKHAARSFSIVAAAEPGGSATAWTFKAGTQIDILFNGDLVCRGFVDRYQPKRRGHSAAEIVISGRSKSQDYIDSSAMHDTNQFKNKDPQEIGTELDQFGVGISTDQKLKKIPTYRITPGETAFRCIERLCREQGVFMVGQADGSIKITTGGQNRHAGALMEGVNIEEAEADHNWSGRHSHVHVRGQKPSGQNDDDLQVEGTAQDSDVNRYRPVLVHHDGDTDNDRAKKRAATRRDREAGNALKANITTQGFRDDAGKVFEPGYLIFVQDTFLDIQQDMAIECVEFSQDRKDGSWSGISLVDPRALGGKGAKGGSAGDAWSSDAGDDN